MLDESVTKREVLKGFISVEIRGEERGDRLRGLWFKFPPSYNRQSMI